MLTSLYTFQKIHATVKKTSQYDSSDDVFFHNCVVALNTLCVNGHIFHIFFRSRRMFGVSVTHASHTQMTSHNDRLTFELYKSFGTLTFSSIGVNGMQVHNGEITFSFVKCTALYKKTLRERNAVLFKPIVGSDMDKPNH